MPARRPRHSLASTERRHETGLIAPGKKVVKKKSQPNFAEPSHAKPPSPNANELISEGKAHTSGYSLGLRDDAYEHSDFDPMESPSRSDSEGYGGRTDSPSGRRKASADRHGSSITNGNLHAANGISTNVEQHVASSLNDSVTTVIDPHYRWDVLAILSLLLQLPPVFQVLVQLGFAYMTFGNPTSSWTPISLASTPDWNRSHGGNPSAIVSLGLDLFFFGFWLVLPYMKDFVLDLAPAIVAISLGGGAAGATSWTHASLCTVTVLADHVLKDQRRRQYVFNVMLAFLSRMSLSTKVPDMSILPPSTQTSRTWARIGLELHIVTHGCVKVIRRWVESNARQPNRRDPSRIDMETPSPSNGLSTAVAGDLAADSVRNGSTDGRPPGPSPAARERAISSGRRRRKQATFVRSQQPFWAAIAYARVNLSKEIEQSHASRDSFESGSKDRYQLGDARFNFSGDRAWITKVEDTEIWFSALLAKASDEPNMVETGGQDGNDNNQPPTAERRGSFGSRLVSIRVNGAVWSSVDCVDWLAAEDHPEWHQVDGKIIGLTPFASYMIEVIRISDHSTLYSGSVLTRPVNSPDRALSIPNIPTVPSDTLRPSSPTTTLKKSIATVEAKLAEHKNKSNKTKKSHQTITRNLRQDISDLTKSLQSSGTDERQRQRQFQYRQNIKQAEESAAEFEEKLANMGDIPTANKEAYEASKSRHEAALELRNETRKALEASQRESQKSISDAQAENAKLRAKREKTEARLNNLTERCKATAEEINTRRFAKVASERASANRMEYHRQQERELLKKLQFCHQQSREIEARKYELQQRYFPENNNFAYPFNGQHSLTQTPEPAYASISNVGRAPPAPAPAPPANFQNPIGTPALHSHSRQSSTRNRTRPRSTSMLSDTGSGHTFDETILKPSNAVFEDAQIPRNGSAGSGSDNARDPKNPTSPPAPKLSPIGTEVGRGSPKSLRR